MDTLKTDEMDGHNERQKRIERQRERKTRRHKDIETIQIHKSTDNLKDEKQTQKDNDKTNEQH